MTVQIFSKSRLLTSRQFLEHLKQEHGETITMQEQFSGPVPLRRERPAAEILAERLAEADLASMSPVFIP
jgi:hypothetical protein